MNNPTDIAQSEIDDLIRSEQDPRNRAMLPTTPQPLSAAAY